MNVTSHEVSNIQPLVRGGVRGAFGCIRDPVGQLPRGHRSRQQIVLAKAIVAIRNAPPIRNCSTTASPRQRSSNSAAHNATTAAASNVQRSRHGGQPCVSAAVAIPGLHPAFFRGPPVMSCTRCPPDHGHRPETGPASAAGEVFLADLHAVMAHQVVGGGVVEIEIRNRKLQQVFQSGHFQRALAHRY